MRMGNAQINTNPCTQAEQNANWSVVEQFFSNFVELANADHKVAINANDEANLTADFLDAKVESLATPSPGQVPVRAVAYNDLTELFYWDSAEIDNWNNTDKLYMVLDGGVPVWQLGTNDVDTKTVLVSATDSTDKYFSECVEDQDAIVSDADLIVVGNVIGGAATNQTVQFAVDVSAISGHHATEFRLLGIEANVSAYKTITAVGVELVDDSTFITNLTDALNLSGGSGGTAKFGKADVAIARRSSATVAPSGTVSIWTMDGSGNLSDTGDNETWFNISSTGQVRAGDFIQGKLDATSGKMLIDFEECTESDL